MEPYRRGMGSYSGRAAHESAWIVLEWLYDRREEDVLWWNYQIIYNHDKKRWLIQFDNDDDDQYMRYDAVLRFADEGADTFHDYKLPAIPIPPPQDEVIHNQELFVIDKLNWTKIIQGTNNPEVSNMEPIPYTGEREEFDVDITEEEINSMKDSNGTIRFMHECNEMVSSSF